MFRKLQEERLVNRPDASYLSDGYIGSEGCESGYRNVHTDRGSGFLTAALEGTVDLICGGGAKLTPVVSGRTDHPNLIPGSEFVWEYDWGRASRREEYVMTVELCRQHHFTLSLFSSVESILECEGANYAVEGMDDTFMIDFSPVGFF